MASLIHLSSLLPFSLDICDMIVEYTTPTANVRFKFGVRPYCYSTRRFYADRMDVACSKLSEADEPGAIVSAIARRFLCKPEQQAAKLTNIRDIRFYVEHAQELYRALTFAFDRQTHFELLWTCDDARYPTLNALWTNGFVDGLEDINASDKTSDIAIYPLHILPPEVQSCEQSLRDYALKAKLECNFANDANGCVRDRVRCCDDPCGRACPLCYGDADKHELVRCV